MSAMAPKCGRGTTVHVVVAPDKFKGSLTAREVADRVAAGIAEVAAGVDVVRVPVADGGDGTVDAALAAGYQRIPLRATGPTGERSTPPTRCATGSPWSRWPMCRVCGCSRRTGSRRSPRPPTARARSPAPAGPGLPQRRARHRGSASTAAARGCWRPSASGCWTRPGTRCPRRRPGRPRPRRPTGLHPRWPARGSSSPATSTTRCSARRAPPRCTGRRRARGQPTSGRWTPRSPTGRIWSTLRRTRGRPRPRGRRAAGGVGYAAMAVLGAELEPGIGLVLDLVRFADHLPGASLVITGRVARRADPAR